MKAFKENLDPPSSVQRGVGKPSALLRYGTHPLQQQGKVGRRVWISPPRGVPFLAGGPPSPGLLSEAPGLLTCPLQGSLDLNPAWPPKAHQLCLQTCKPRHTLGARHREQRWSWRAGCEGWESCTVAWPGVSKDHAADGRGDRVGLWPGERQRVVPSFLP